MAKKRRKMLIVDGYNVLRSGQRYVHMRHNPDYTHVPYNAVREALISDVAAYAGTEYKAVIVFDAAENPESAGKTQNIGGVKVIFSPHGVSADHVIEKTAHDAAEKGLEVIVVTSDAAIQDAVFGGGVDRMSANGFSREMEMLKEDTRLDEAPKVARKMTVSDRLDPSTLAKLKALRDGK
jgi:predicted RNA-binding protein with PIN domain